MSKIFNKKTDTLGEEISRIEDLLHNGIPGDDSYLANLGILERLYYVRDEQTKIKPTIKPEVLMTCVVGLLKVVMILNYERFDSISTKAFSVVKD